MFFIVCLQPRIPKTVLCYYLCVCCVCLKTWNCCRTKWIMEAWKLQWIMTEESYSSIILQMICSEGLAECMYNKYIHIWLGHISLVRHSKLYNLAWTRNKIPSCVAPRHLLTLNWSQYKTHKHMIPRFLYFKWFNASPLCLTNFYPFFNTVLTHQGPIKIWRLCNLWNPRTSIITYSQCLWATTSWSFYCPPGISLHPA